MCADIQLHDKSQRQGLEQGSHQQNAFTKILFERHEQNQSAAGGTQA